MIPILCELGAREENLTTRGRLCSLTGSHNLQILWHETGEGRTLEQFPFAYIVAEKMWAPVSETFLMPPDMKESYSIGAWNGACMDCHVTQGESKFRRGQQMGYAGRRIRDRLRSVSQRRTRAYRRAIATRFGAGNFT